MSLCFAIAAVAPVLAFARAVYVLRNNRKAERLERRLNELCRKEGKRG